MNQSRSFLVAFPNGPNEVFLTAPVPNNDGASLFSDLGFSLDSDSSAHVIGINPRDGVCFCIEKEAGAQRTLANRYFHYEWTPNGTLLQERFGKVGC